MRDVAPGDLILHCCDSVLRGFSFAASRYREVTEEPPLARRWAGRAPYYRIELERYTLLPTPVTVSVFLDNYAEEIRQELQERRIPYYPFALEEGSGKLTLRQGYLSRCTPRLYQLIRASGLEPRVHTTDAPPQHTPSHALRPQPSPERRTRYWAVGAGPGGSFWNEFQEKRIIAIGWDYLGDLRQYQSSGAILQAMKQAGGPEEPSPTNKARACYEFAREMAVGDYVAVKIGRDKLLGIGTVQSEYIHDPSRPEYHNVRRVRWLHAANLDIPKGAQVPPKALTDVSDNQKFTQFLHENLLDIAPQPEPQELPPFTVEEAMEGLFLPRAQFDSVLSALRRKKNVILQGPPGVGKTFIAGRLAYALLGHQDRNRFQMVQFHQSYAYEDFVQGIRPRAGGFQRRDGIFYDFCNRARLDRDKPFVFIIDEINRGNLSRIFGELLMLIEADKRGPDFAIPLTYSESGDERFSVPDNVHLIGLMNTADRSLAMVDYALRRRFVFFDLEPQFNSPAFRSALLERGMPEQLAQRIIERLSEVNAHITADQKNLGRGYTIGHSFFCPSAGAVSPSLFPAFEWEGWYRDVVQTEIAPLLNEYWFDEADRAAGLIARLLEL
jgi:hypothetical protein